MQLLRSLFRSTSRWASRHVPVAITLIILLEIVNGFISVMLGATLLETAPTAALYGGTALVMIFATDVRRLFYTGPDTDNFRRWCLIGAFLSNFLLFGLVGGLLVPRPQQRAEPTGVWGYHRVEIRSDTLVRPDTLRPAEPPAAVANADRRSAGRIKAGFVAMFVLSLILVLVTGLIACGVACSGYGFLAGVVSVLGLGFLAGGIYFLGRAGDKPIRDRGEPTPPNAGATPGDSG